MKSPRNGEISWSACSYTLAVATIVRIHCLLGNISMLLYSQISPQLWALPKLCLHLFRTKHSASKFAIRTKRESPGSGSGIPGSTMFRWRFPKPCQILLSTTPVIDLKLKINPTFFDKSAITFDIFYIFVDFHWWLLKFVKSSFSLLGLDLILTLLDLIDARRNDFQPTNYSSTSAMGWGTVGPAMGEMSKLWHPKSLSKNMQGYFKSLMKSSTSPLAILQRTSLLRALHTPDVCLKLTAFFFISSQS